MERHRKRHVPSTKTRGPWELKRREVFPNRKEAAARERYLKPLKSRKAVEEIIEGCRGSSVGRAQD